MTRGEMIKQIRLRNAEFAGTDGDRTPQTLAYHLVDECNQLALTYWAYYETKWQDIVLDNDTPPQPQFFYKATGARSVEEVSVLTADGNIAILGVRTPTQMDCEFGSSWRNPQTATVGTPYIYVSRGRTSFELYPRPSYTTTCMTGIGIEGYFQPGVVWDGSLLTSSEVQYPAGGGVTWLVNPYSDKSSQDEAECPLGADGELAVLLGAIIRRIKEIRNPDWRDAVAAYKDEYRTAMANLATSAKQQSRAIRQQTRGRGGQGSFVYVGSI